MNTPDNKRIIIPNSSLMSGNITNYTANPTRRVDIPVTIGAAYDLAQAQKILLETANADTRVLKTPPAAAANAKLVDGGTVVELRAWCKTGDYGLVLNDLLQRASANLAQAGIKGIDKTLYYVERK